MASNQSSYRQIIKATSIFGGVQVFNILISIIRSKFIAVLLGPAGMGIAGSLISTMGLVGSITSFGIGSSAVRNVSVAVSSEDPEQIRTAASVVRRLAWMTGLLGTLVVIFLSPLLSEITFGNKNYTTSFLCVSITLLLSQMNTGQVVIMQGMRKLQYLAKADLTGMLAGLLISIPLYYELGPGGIVPAIIISSFLTLLFSRFFTSKVQIAKVKVDKSIFKSEGIQILKIGFMLSLSGFISPVTYNILRIFITRTGGIEQVGLYSSGFAIINNYVGMIFTAMLTDYYPRLAQVSSDNKQSKKVMNEQGEIAILLIAPILICFLTFINWIIIILYSNRFVVITGMLHLASLGMFFKTASWTIGIIFLAKGSSKMYFWNEFIANIYLLLFNILGYKFFGLDGLGISFLVGYIVFCLQVFIVAKRSYAFNFENAFYKIFIIQLLLAVLCFVTMEKMSSPFSYIVGILFTLLSAYYSFVELNKRLAIGEIFSGLMSKIKKRSVSY